MIRRLVLIAGVGIAADATSSKMDFLPLANVRTDPIINPGCLSDHVHTFYGAAASLRPETTYDDLRAADETSGNVKENKSLYWHPTVYMFDSETGIYTAADIWFASAYYVWQTGQPRAFPKGFQMIARGSNKESHAKVECSGPSPCERKNCETTSDSFFPQTACYELEVKLVFPTCWDGRNLDSENHMDHVSYDVDGGQFDGDCPTSHPVKLPEIHFYFRIKEYKGGQYMFSDGSDVYHTDYMSGWDEEELQKVLDECENDSDAASPDAFCQNFFTYRDAPKAKKDDNDIAVTLAGLQPSPPIDPKKTITTEAISGIKQLPRGSCTGKLLPAGTNNGGANNNGDTNNGGTDHEGPADNGNAPVTSGNDSTFSTYLFLNWLLIFLAKFFQEAPFHQ